ncbi:MAG: ankyrin repeat domain-containing protein [Phaeodactylibacter sp.]|nr:ankyrin repeat domain-containing protein [Phaeodactylibacter sp.]
MESTTFFEAIAKGDLEQVRAQVQQHPALLQTTNAQNASPLLWAIYTRQATVRDYLREQVTQLTIFEAAALGDLPALQQRLEPEAVNRFAPDGFTCLGLAVFLGQEAVVRWLLGQGADLNLPSNNAFQVAPIHSAAATGNLNLLKLLVESGAQVNCSQANGVTPLHSAAHLGQLEMVVYLLDRGANPSARMTDGSTPLDLARKDQQEKVVALLEQQPPA